MFKERDTVIRRFMRVLDGAVIISAFPLAYYLRERFHHYYKIDIFPHRHLIGKTVASFDQYLSFLAVVIIIWIGTLTLLGAYRSFRTRRIYEIAQIIILSAIYTTLISATVGFLLKIGYVSRVMFVIFMGLASVFLILERGIFLSVIRFMRLMGYNYRRMLIVGSGSRAQKFIKVIERHPEWGFKINGIVDDDHSKINQSVIGYPVIGVLKDIPDILHSRAIDEVVFIVPRGWLNRIEPAISACENEGVKATLAADLFDLKIATAKQTELGGIPLMAFEPARAHEGKLFLKRFIDVVFSAAALAALSPLMTAIAILIKSTSKGPVLYVQRRVGRNGRRFVLYKFRSMYPDAHKRLSEVMADNEASGPVFKIKNDPRITPVGRFLRRYSLDELPQLFNILMGCMSLVGPRPPLPREVCRYEPWQRRRLSMRPGLTCLWQVNGRNRVGFDEWMKLDLQYIDNWSIWLDLKILFRTLPAVIFARGAH